MDIRSWLKYYFFWCCELDFLQWKGEIYYTQADYDTARTYNNTIWTTEIEYDPVPNVFSH